MRVERIYGVEYSVLRIRPFFFVDNIPFCMPSNLHALVVSDVVDSSLTARDNGKRNDFSMSRLISIIRGVITVEQQHRHNSLLLPVS